MLRIGSGAGAAPDRIGPALELAEHGNLDYLVFECLAERTIAMALLQKRANPDLGYNNMLEERFEKLLPIMQRKHFRVISNMGAANPIGAGKALIKLAKKMGYNLKVAVVTGDDVIDVLDTKQNSLEYGEPIDSRGPLVSANAYIGVEAILPALKTDAQVIITGRAADPSIFLAPMVYHYGWEADDWDRLAAGTVAGHLLECSGQVTGGYYADPGKKDVPNLHKIGYPLAEVAEDGSFVITKVEGTGGCVTLGTVKEQLLYEIINPHAYLTPDVSADFTSLHLEQIGVDRVKVTRTKGNPRPEKLKVSVGYQGGYIGEGHIVLAGPNAVGRAKLGAEIVLGATEGTYSEVRTDIVGFNSIHGELISKDSRPYEVMLRMACRTDTLQKAKAFGNEVGLLCLTGLAGAGGLWDSARPVLGIISVLIDRNLVPTTVTLLSTEEA